MTANPPTDAVATPTATAPPPPPAARDRPSPESGSPLLAAAIAVELVSGHRERTRGEAIRHITVRVARLTAGATMLLIGLALLVLPGPGLLVVLLGLALLARDIPWAARALEAARRRLPERANTGLSRRTITLAAIAGLALSAASLGYALS